MIMTTLFPIGGATLISVYIAVLCALGVLCYFLADETYRKDIYEEPAERRLVAEQRDDLVKDLRLGVDVGGTFLRPRRARGGKSTAAESPPPQRPVGRRNRRDQAPRRSKRARSSPSPTA